MRITLDSAEAFHAGMAGYMRMFRVMTNGYKSPFDGLASSDGWRSHIEGAIAELVVAKATNKYWPGPTWSFKDLNDVGPYEVRYTQYAQGHLLLYPSDKDQAPYILVTGKYPDYEIAGWIYGRYGKHPDYWTEETKQPCYKIPQTALEPYETLHTAHGK
jgi:hypothetical protein